MCAVRCQDPNGPMYDPVHGIYHNFYQIHIAEDQNGAGNGPDWGHWVSKDFIHWAQLPVAIWNDEYYDNSAIFTGSATIVNGKPVMMYPGKCNLKGLKPGEGCNAVRDRSARSSHHFRCFQAPLRTRVEMELPLSLP